MAKTRKGIKPYGDTAGPPKTFRLSPFARTILRAARARANRYEVAVVEHLLRAHGHEITAATFAERDESQAAA